MTPPALALEAPQPLLIGVVHLLATPGAPGYGGSVGVLCERAALDARALREGGADALIVENFGDTPFFAQAVPAETVAAMALGIRAVQDAAGALPVGVNVLRNDARAALGLCAATGASFVRVNVHSGAYVTDQGLIEGQAAATLRAREQLAPHALVLADVHVKHARPLAHVDIEQAAHDTFVRGRADALIVTGSGTGAACERDELVRVRAALPSAPLLIGSGVTASNAAELLPHANGAIVGTALKRDGRVEQEVDVERVRALRRAFDALKS